MFVQHIEQWKMRMFLQHRRQRRRKLRTSSCGEHGRADWRHGVPRCPGPAKILDIDDTCVTAKFQSQTFNVARYCARTKVACEPAGDLRKWLRGGTGLRNEGNGMDVDEAKGETGPTTGISGDGSRTLRKQSRRQIRRRRRRRSPPRIGPLCNILRRSHRLAETVNQY